jgi:ketosteroid isomerase-like protein
VEEARRDAGVSDQNVDVIHEVGDAMASGDTASIAARLHVDVVWEHNLGGGSPEEGVYRGRDDVVRLFERILEPWEYLRSKPRSINQVGEGRYRVAGDLIAKHRTSKVEIASSYEQELEFRDGLLVKGAMKTSDISL